MRLRNEHPPDRDLVMLLDGELSHGCAARTRAHVDACWSCRARLQELEGAIAGYVRARAVELEPAPRALFRARLSDVAAEPAKRTFDWRMVPAAAMALVAAGLFGVFGNVLRGDASSPKSQLTPGETRPVAVSDLCGAGFREETVRVVPDDVKTQVFAEYGMRNASPDAYEVDYLITPGLGGADSILNMWPQPYSARWNARVKDKLEDHLHSLVCAGTIDLATAQREISTDWIGAYKKYFRTDRPL